MLIVLSIHFLCRLFQPIVGEAEEFLPDCPDEYIALPDPTDEIKVVSQEAEHSSGLVGNPILYLLTNCFL